MEDAVTGLIVWMAKKNNTMHLWDNRDHHLTAEIKWDHDFRVFRVIITW